MIIAANAVQIAQKMLNIYKKSKFFRNNIPVNWKIYLKSLHPCIEIKTFIQYNQY